MIELEVSNFQAIRHATMAVDGFAAIVGRSNIGKSAIVRAAQHALTGAQGTDFVRHGQECDRKVRQTKKCKCFAKVVIRTAAMNLTWEKGDNVSRYTVERPGVAAEVFEGLERGTPEFLKAGYQPVNVGGKKELIQVPDQFSPIFLLDQTGPVVADVISDVAKLDSLNQAMGSANKDRKDAVAKRKVREGDVESLQTSLALYTGLDDVPVGGLTADFKDLESKSRELAQVQAFALEYDALGVGIQSLDEALKPPLPDNEALETLGQRLTQVADFYDALTEKVPAIRALLGVDKIEVPDEAPLGAAHDKLLQVVGFLRRLDGVERAVEQWSGAGDVELPDPQYEAPWVRLQEVALFTQRWNTLQAELSRAPEVGDLPDMDTLRQKFDEYERHHRLLGDAKSLAEVIKATTLKVKEAEEEEAQALAELEALGVCPTCDQPVGEHHRLHLEAV